MLVEKAESASVESAQRASFFRQSGWLMMANIGGGMLMLAVHFLSRAIPPGQYGDFGFMLAVVMLLPTLPLQMVMAQQTAKALALNRQAELAGLIRWVWVVLTALWLVVAALAVGFQQVILERWHMTSASELWITMAVLLLSVWMPMFFGVLQGKQNFLWLGWAMVSNAAGRIGFAAFAVLVLHAYATGMVGGVLFGTTVAAIIGAWHSRSLWLAPSLPFDWRSLLRQVVPLFIGFLGFQILFTADTIFVKAYFGKVNADYYVSAGTMSRALMWLVLPLASVMFPRLVHSAAKSEKTNLMGVVLLGTAVLAIVGALALSVFGPLAVRVVYPREYVKVVPALLPWYVSAMVPLGLANVLLNHLLARPSSKLFASLCILALALVYLFALTRFHDSMIMVLQTLAIANLVLLAICAWFTWGPKKDTALAQLEKPEPV